MLGGSTGESDLYLWIRGIETTTPSLPKPLQQVSTAEVAIVSHSLRVQGHVTCGTKSLQQEMTLHSCKKLESHLIKVASFPYDTVRKRI